MNLIFVMQKLWVCAIIPPPPPVVQFLCRWRLYKCSSTCVKETPHDVVLPYILKTASQVIVPFIAQIS